MSNPSAVAVYARISSDTDGTNLGVNRQLADCRTLADQLGWMIAEEYVDNDLSAFTGKRRPRYEQMLDDVRDGLRDGVIAYHVDRLTRRPIELEQFLETLDGAGVRHFRVVSGPAVDISNGDGLMVLRMIGAVAANESATKSRRVQRKMVEVAAEGRPHGGTRPYGFENDRVTVRPEEAEVIRALADRYLAGESLRSLAVWLNDQAIPSRSGKEWLSSTVRTVLKSGRIAGLREHRGEVVGPAVWDAIITPEQHTRIRALMNQQAVNRTRSPRSYLLSGLLRCGRCGTNLFSAARATSRRYVCSSGPDHHGCGKLTVVAGPLEELIADAVLYRLDTPELIDTLAGRSAADSEAATITEAITQDTSQLEELAELYAAKAITAREWMVARRPIEERLRSLGRQLGRLTRAETLGGYLGNGDALRAQWSGLNLTRQHAIVRAVLDHAVIGPGTPGARRLDPGRVDLVWRV